MKPKEAKTIVEKFLQDNNVEYLKTTAKTVSFEDLARGECIFVTVYNAAPGMYWLDVQKLAMQNDFRVKQALI